MKVVCYNQKGRHLDTVEKLYIYKGTLKRSPLSDEHTCFHLQQNIEQRFRLMKFHFLCGIMEVICKQTNSKHASDLLIAREVREIK